MEYKDRPPSENGVVRENYTSHQKALIIFNEFAIGQICLIKGLEIERSDRQKLVESGDVVLGYIKSMDRRKNFKTAAGDGRERRKVRKPVNTIGNYVGQKAFQYKKETRDGMPCTTIWRVQ